MSILIPTHNRAAFLRRTLASLSALDVPAGVVVEIVVVANACTDGTVDVVREARGSQKCRVRLIEEPRPGLNRARSRGVAAASADLIAFLDDDVWLEPGWLQALLWAARNLPAQVFAGRVTLEWETHRPLWTSSAVEHLLSINDPGGEVRELVGSIRLVGANFALRRSVIDRVGDFLPTLDRCGSDLLSGGESELVLRAVAAGDRVFYVPQMAVRHWVPEARATLEHLKALAFGRGRTRVAFERQNRTKGTIACARLGAAQTLLGGIRTLRAWLRRDDAMKVAAILLCCRGLGTLFAFLQVQTEKSRVYGHGGRAGMKGQAVRGPKLRRGADR